MKKTQKVIMLLALVLTTALVFSGCESLFGGGSNKSKSTSSAAKEPDDRDTSWYDGKSKETTFYIADDKQLGGLSKLTNLSKNPVDFQGKTIVLTGNIDMGGKNFRPIGPFSGTFDGKGFSISNLVITDYKGGALFSEVTMGKIMNLTVNVQKVENKKNSGDIVIAGGLVGMGMGITIENCGVNIKEGVIANPDKGITYAGGLIAIVDGVPMMNSAINNCYVNGNVTISSGSAGGYNGGLVGVVGMSLMKATLNINNSYYNGNISATAGGTDNLMVGGLVGGCGLSQIDIKNAYATSAITTATGPRGEAFVGGILGRWAGGTNTSVFYNSTKVTAQKISSGTRDGSLPTGITGLSDADMKKQASFAGFDFGSVWGIESGTNGGYPYLRWQKK